MNSGVFFAQSTVKSYVNRTTLREEIHCSKVVAYCIMCYCIATHTLTTWGVAAGFCCVTVDEVEVPPPAPAFTTINCPCSFFTIIAPGGNWKPGGSVIQPCKQKQQEVSYYAHLHCLAGRHHVHTFFTFNTEGWSNPENQTMHWWQDTNEVLIHFTLLGDQMHTLAHNAVVAARNQNTSSYLPANHCVTDLKEGNHW